MSEMIVDYWLLEYDDNDNSLLKVTKINNNNHDCSIIKRDKYFNRYGNSNVGIFF